MSDTDISTREKYYDYVNFTVECIINEYKDYPESEISELVFSHVDNAKIIMYYSYNMDILQNSYNDPEEWKHFVGENENYKEVIQAMAFDVFRQDVWEKLNDKNIDF